MKQQFPDDAIELAKGKGYTVDRSDWVISGGGKGHSFIVFTPDFNRLPDDYGTEDQAWAAAVEHAKSWINDEPTGGRTPE